MSKITNECFTGLAQDATVDNWRK